MSCSSPYSLRAGAVSNRVASHVAPVRHLILSGKTLPHEDLDCRQCNGLMHDVYCKRMLSHKCKWWKYVSVHPCWDLASRSREPPRCKRARKKQEAEGNDGVVIGRSEFRPRKTEPCETLKGAARPWHHVKHHECEHQESRACRWSLGDQARRELIHGAPKQRAGRHAVHDSV